MVTGTGGIRFAIACRMLTVGPPPVVALLLATGFACSDFAGPWKLGVLRALVFVAARAFTAGLLAGGATRTAGLVDVVILPRPITS